MHNVSSHEALAQNIPSGIEVFKPILAPAAKAAGYLYLDRVGAEVYLCLCTLSIASFVNQAQRRVSIVVMKNGKETKL